MLKKILLISCVTSFLFGCQTLNISQKSQAKTTQQVALGSVGLNKDFILQRGFNSAAIPSYKKPIKVSVEVKPFNKQTYKTFTKAKVLQSADVSVRFIDSLINKPKHVNLQIADKVALIDALNSSENSSVKKYLSHKTDANILTSISVALNQNDLDAITKSDAVFLAEKGLKTYVLQLYKNGAKAQTIFFNQGVVFGYETSNCCWQDNKRHQLNIVDLVSEFNNCPNSTYRSAKRAEKKMNTLSY